MKFFLIVSALVAAAQADADADAALLYGGHHLGYSGQHLGYAGIGYGHVGYGYAGLKSSACVNAANVPVPCAGYTHGLYGYGLNGVHGIHKREADPALLYSGHLGYAGYHGLGYAGLGYGLGYAHHGVGLVAGPGLPHGIATTGYGLGVHSSLVGICTNVDGAQVSC